MWRCVSFLEVWTGYAHYMHLRSPYSLQTFFVLLLSLTGPFQADLTANAYLPSYLTSVDIAPMYEPYTPPPEHFNEAVLNWGEERPSGADGRILQATVAVIGAGFVGLHLIKAFSQRHRVIAYDIDDRRLMELTSSGVGEDVLCTSNPEELRSAEYFLIAVPTKVNHDNTINANAVQSAIDMVAQYANDGATIVIESSVAIGMTRELLTPAIHLRGFRGGMSPERVDPGRTFPKFHSIPKIVSGLDDISPGSLKAISSLYCTIFSEVVPVSCPEVAEMTKLYENCQRMINIAYANEMADACSEIGIDPFEVSRAAATKPFGYQPYTPSPGVGGMSLSCREQFSNDSSVFRSLYSSESLLLAAQLRVPTS